jgi:hypothetical protein
MNDCTGELVAVAGTEHFKATDNTSLTDTKSQLEMNLTGASGIGLVSGARYVMNNQTSTMDHQEFDPLGDAQLTMETSTIFNRQGETAGLMAGDDSRLHVLAHLTITDGVTKSVKNDLRFDCS